MSFVSKQVSEYVIFVDSPQEQWLHERASMFRYTYIACPVLFTVDKNLSLTE
jgi:hypothetical protein